MRKIILLSVLLCLLLSGCTKYNNTVVIGRDISTHSVDVRLENGDVKTVNLTREEFYSGDFEVGEQVDIGCVVGACVSREVK